MKKRQKIVADAEVVDYIPTRNADNTPQENAPAANPQAIEAAANLQGAPTPPGYVSPEAVTRTLAQPAEEPQPAPATTPQAQPQAKPDPVVQRLHTIHLERVITQGIAAGTMRTSADAVAAAEGLQLQLEPQQVASVFAKVQGASSAPPAPAANQPAPLARPASSPPQPTPKPKSPDPRQSLDAMIRSGIAQGVVSSPDHVGELAKTLGVKLGDGEGGKLFQQHSVAVNPPPAAQLRETVLSAPPEAAEASQGQTAEPTQQADGLDRLQMGLDAYGVVGDAVVPGSGVLADGANSVLSIVRAVKEPHRAGEHLKNAAISAVSMIPFIGDTAKLFKYGGKAGAAAGKAGKLGDAARPLVDGVKRGRKDSFMQNIVGAFTGSVTGSPPTAPGGGGGAGGGAGGGGSGGQPPQGPGTPGGSAPAPGGQPQGATSQQASGWLNSALNAVSDLTKRFGLMGVAIGAVVLGGRKLIAWLNDLDAKNRAIIEENRNLSQFSGVSAAAYAQLDRARLRRDIEAGQDMSGPISRLIGAQNRLEANMEELSRPLKQISVDIQAILTEVAAGIVLIVDAIEPITEFAEWWYGEQKRNASASTIGEAIARDSEIRMTGRKL